MQAVQVRVQRRCHVREPCAGQKASAQLQGKFVDCKLFGNLRVVCQFITYKVENKICKSCIHFCEI